MPKNNQLNSSLLTALNEEFSTSVNLIYINSLDREIGFRDISVLEQKTLAKTLIANENRPDIVYDAQTALIQKICLDKSINIRDISEFDRIKILLAMYQVNFFADSTELECAHCGTKANYNVNFEKALENLNKVKLNDIKINETYGNREYEFTIAFPTVGRTSAYYKHNAKTLENNKKIKDPVAFASNESDMIDIFIKHIKIINKTTNNIIEIDPITMSFQEYMQVLNVLPQNIIFNSNSKLVVAIADLFSSLHDSFEPLKCISCGEELEFNQSLAGFFTL